MRRAAGFARRHAAFGVLAVLGLVGRVLVIVTYRPALVYLGDSAAYANQAWKGLWPGDWRPSGYPMFLRLVDGHAHLTRLVVIQHLLTFVTAVALYAAALRALRRRDGTPGRAWVAALAAAPALLSPWVLDLGQFMLADSLFASLVCAGIVVLARPGPASLPACLASGLLLGTAVVIRTVGYGPLAVGGAVLAVVALARLRRPSFAPRAASRPGVPAGAGVLPGPGEPTREVHLARPDADTGRVGSVRRRTHAKAAWVWRAGRRFPTTLFGAPYRHRREFRHEHRRVHLSCVHLSSSRRSVLTAIAGFAAVAAVPMFAYSAWSAANGGNFSVSAHSGFFLYGRLAPFADCTALSSPELRSLCDDPPLPVAERPQPDIYLWHDDAPLRGGNDDIPPGREELAGQFASEVLREQPWMVARTTVTYLAGYFSPTRHENAKTSRASTWELPDELTNVLPKDDPHHFDGYYVATELDENLAPALAGYSKLVYAPMPLVGAGLVAGLAAAAVGWRRGRAGPPRLFWLAGGAGMSVLTIGALTAGFDYRYLASVIALLGAASVVGAVSLARALR